MPHPTATPQATATESRTDKVAIAVTPTEKRAVRAIAAVRGTDESNLCRAMPIDEIVTAFERLQAAEGEVV